MCDVSEHVIDDIVNFVYNGKERHGEVVRIATWGITVNVYGEGFKSFRYDKMKSVRTICHAV